MNHSTVQSAVLDRITEMWGIHEPGFSGLVMNSAVVPSAVWAELAREFGDAAVRDDVARYLVVQGRRELDERYPEPDDMFLIGCCLALCKGAIELDVATMKALLWSLAPVGYYREMRVLTKRRFDQAQLIHVLAEGIRSAKNEMMCACAMQGLQAYVHEVKASPDVSLCPALVDYEAALRPIFGTTHAILAETSQTALKVLWDLRADKSCSRVDVAELTAYRVHDDSTTHYTVERQSDRYVVLRIPRLEVVDRTLVVQYRNQEPTLLPDDVPATLECVLLPSHVPDYEGVERVMFVDLVLERTVERPPARTRTH